MCDAIGAYALLGVLVLLALSPHVALCTVILYPYAHFSGGFDFRFGWKKRENPRFFGGSRLSREPKIFAALDAGYKPNYFKGSVWFSLKDQ